VAKNLGVAKIVLETDCLSAAGKLRDKDRDHRRHQGVSEGF
jgi:hypothetical protein